MNPPQDQPGPDDEDDDQQRGVEDGLLTFAGQEARGAGGELTTTTTATASEQDLAPAGLAHVGHSLATVRLGRDADRGDEDPSGQRAPHAGEQSRLRAVEGHRQVGADDGSDGSPEVRSTAVGVSTATTGTPASRACG